MYYRLHVYIWVFFMSHLVWVMTGWCTGIWFKLPDTTHATLGMGHLLCMCYLEESLYHHYHYHLELEIVGSGKWKVSEMRSELHAVEWVACREYLVFAKYLGFLL